MHTQTAQMQLEQRHTNPVTRTGGASAQDIPMPFDVFAGVKRALKMASGHISLVPRTGAAAWDSVIKTTLAPGDTVIVVGPAKATAEWTELAMRLGLNVEVIAQEPNSPNAVTALSRRLGRDRDDEIAAVFAPCLGSGDLVAAIRYVLDENFHEALLLVDGGTALDTGLFRMSEWDVDVVVTAQPQAQIALADLSVVGFSDRTQPAQQALAA